MSEVEKRLWRMGIGLAMIIQGALLFLTLGFYNCHLYLLLAIWYSDRELQLSRDK